MGNPVPRARVERFARRHRLTITAANGNQVIRYLATTRRWRSAGLIGGLVVSIAASLPRGEVRLEFLPLFAGWFAGALAAEARITHLSPRPRRAASLVRRDADRYLPRPHRALVPIAAGLCATVGAATLVVASTGRQAAYGEAVLWLLAGLAVATGIHLMQRRALGRPQPVVEPDVLAADDAIRSRSLHVLAAAGAVLILHSVFAQLAILLSAVDNSPGSPPWLLAGPLAVPLLGWIAASTSWTVPPLAKQPATSTAANGTGQP